MNGSLLSDRYQILNSLGAGGMGQTYVAEDTQRPGHPKCVVKQLKPASDDPNFLATARRLFVGEAEMLEKLGKHEQIPQLLAHFEKDGEFYLVQEFIDGQPLSAELPLGQRWPEPQVVALLKDILVILEFIHGQGVIHRDIKPDNIVRRKQDGRLVLIDFGAVKQVRMQQTTAVGQVSVTVAIGTPGYMPTEQSSGKPRPSSDIYALGMVAIQALTGLFPAQLREDDDGEVIWRDQAEVSDGLANILTTMTHHYFKHRYQSAFEVRQALHELETPGSVVNGAYTPTQVAGSGNYAPTQASGNGRGYTPTAVIPGYTPTQGTSNGTSGASSTLPSHPQQVPTANQEQQATAPQTGRAQSQVSNKLLIFGAILLSLLISGGLFYFLRQQQTDNPTDLQTPTPSATSTPTPSATSTPTPSATSTPTPSATSTPTPSATSTPTPSATSTPTPNVRVDGDTWTDPGTGDTWTDPGTGDTWTDPGTGDIWTDPGTGDTWTDPGTGDTWTGPEPTQQDDGALVPDLPDDFVAE